MPEMMICCVKRPEPCGQVIVFTGTIHNWMTVNVPRFGHLCFCPNHHEVAREARKIAEEYEQRLHERDERLAQRLGLR